MLSLRSGQFLEPTKEFIDTKLKNKLKSIFHDISHNLSEILDQIQSVVICFMNDEFILHCIHAFASLRSVP
jgi:hypothetical protein